MGIYGDVSLTKMQLANEATHIRMTTVHTQEGRALIKGHINKLQETADRLSRQLRFVEQLQDELKLEEPSKAPGEPAP